LRFKRTYGLIGGIAATVVGVGLLFFVAKVLGDLLFPEMPGLSVTHAVRSISLAVLTAAFLFFEAYRLFKAAADSNTNAQTIKRVPFL
jgi:ABC-type antimicrobial peptide transport system permease subunit